MQANAGWFWFIEEVRVNGFSRVAAKLLPRVRLRDDAFGQTLGDETAVTFLCRLKHDLVHDGSVHVARVGFNASFRFGGALAGTGAAGCLRVTTVNVHSPLIEFDSGNRAGRPTTETARWATAPYLPEAGKPTTTAATEAVALQNGRCDEPRTVASPDRRVGVQMVALQAGRGWKTAPTGNMRRRGGPRHGGQPVHTNDGGGKRRAPPTTSDATWYHMERGKGGKARREPRSDRGEPRPPKGDGVTRCERRWGGVRRRDNISGSDNFCGHNYQLVIGWGWFFDIGRQRSAVRLGLAGRLRRATNGRMPVRPWEIGPGV